MTRNRVNGVKLGSLRLRNLYGINITRVNRAGIDLLASPDLRLQIGDRLTIVGEANSVNTVGKILGDEIKRLNNPNLLAVFIGISLGMLLGALPITLPGMSTPVKLGIAGGPIIVGILMGAFGPRFHLTTYTTMSANLMLRQLGIIIDRSGFGTLNQHLFSIHQGGCKEIDVASVGDLRPLTQFFYGERKITHGYICLGDCL